MKRRRRRTVKRNTVLFYAGDINEENIRSLKKKVEYEKVGKLWRYFCSVAILSRLLPILLILAHLTAIQNPFITNAHWEIKHSTETCADLRIRSSATTLYTFWLSLKDLTLPKTRQSRFLLNAGMALCSLSGASFSNNANVLFVRLGKAGGHGMVGRIM